MKKIIFYLGILLLLIHEYPAFSAIIANPIISRGKPAYSSSGDASNLVDNQFGGSPFSVTDGSWIAINVGSGYSKVFVSWNNPNYSWSDVIAATNSCKQGISCPVDYTIQTSSNSTNGVDGQWTTVVTVTGNTVTARGHIIDFSGASWVKMNITKGGGFIDEVEVFDLSNNGDDLWFFPGTSITANAFKATVPALDFADVVHQNDSAYTPAMIRGGIPCIKSQDFSDYISQYLQMAGNVKYWAIEMGTNDAWGGSNTGVVTFKHNMQIVIDSCKAAGIEPIIARMIGTNEAVAGWQVNPEYLQAIDDLTTQNNLIAGPDFYTWFSTHPEDLGSDGVHPNASGAASMQRLWAEKMALLYSDTVIYVTGVTVAPDSASISIGATTRLAAIISPSDATNRNLSWSSDNTGIVTVSSTGTVTGIADGTATITATTQDGSFTSSATITVTGSGGTTPCNSPSTISLPLTQNGAGEFCYVTSGDINYINSWNTQTVEINGVDFTNVWANNMPPRINGNYYIHYVSNVDWGHLEISGTDGGTGIIVAVTGVGVAPVSDSVDVGSTNDLTATVSPGNATDQSVSWSTSDPNIATVDSNGVVTGVAPGSATVTVTTNDGGFSASSVITVYQLQLGESGVEVFPVSDTMNVGDTITLTATVYPVNAVDKSVSWSSSDLNVATVNSSGLVTGITAGTATITVTTADGSYTASSVITVLQNNTVTADSVSLNATSTNICLGETLTLVAQVFPNGSNQAVQWSTNNSGVATVSSSGVVTGIAAGSATITATSADGGYTASCAVSVDVCMILVTGVSVTPTSASILADGTIPLTATVSPSNATNQGVSWGSSDTSIATVSSSGIVTGVTTGSATITVKTDDGGFTASSVITVDPGPPCSPVTISIPFSHDGAGEYCWVTSQSIAYINSWNVDMLEINGVDYTNVWSNTLPAPINGNYYIHYIASVDWAHFEAPATKSAASSNTDYKIKVYPVPFKNEIYINPNGLKNIRNVELFNSLGQLVEEEHVDQIGSGIIKLNVKQNGKLFILKIRTNDKVIVRSIVKE